MKNFKKILLSLFLFSSMFALLPFAVKADACSNLEASLQIRDSSGKVIGKLNDGLPKICTASAAITIGINIMLGLAGGVAVVFIVIGGFEYMTSAGNAEAAEKGTKTLRNSVIGLLIIILSAVIVRLAVNLIVNPQVTGGGGSTVTPGAGTQNPSGNTGKVPADFNAETVFGPMVSLPDSVNPSGPLNIGIFIPRTDETIKAELTQIAGGADPSNCKLSVSFNGKNYENNLQATSQQYSTSVNIPGPFNANDNIQVSVKLCQQSILSPIVQVSGDASNGGNDNALVQSALSRIYFTSKWLTQDKTNRKMIVNITANPNSGTPASDTDVNIVCKGQTDQNVHLLLGGTEYDKQPITVKQWPNIIIPDPANTPTIGVTLCGNMLDGNQP